MWHFYRREQTEDLQKKLKNIEKDKESARSVNERSTTNFFVVMGPNLTAINPIKYSNCQLLEKDLLTLTSACACKHQNHKPDANFNIILKDHIRLMNDTLSYRHNDDPFIGIKTLLTCHPLNMCAENYGVLYPRNASSGT